MTRMKMPADMYEALKRDFYLVANAIAETRGPFTLNLASAWRVLHRVEQERQYTGQLRAQLETMTKTPCTVDALPDYRMGPWYDAGLNDSHIETALRRILSA
jgi:hypothetical protein